jgi:hypothetical protein
VTNAESRTRETKPSTGERRAMHAQSFKNKCGARKKKKNKSRRRESIDRRADGMMVFFFHCKMEQAGR